MPTWHWQDWTLLQFFGLLLMIMPVFLAALLFALGPLGAIRNFKDRRIWSPTNRGWWAWTYRDTDPVGYWLTFVIVWTLVPFACADLVAMTLNGLFDFHITFFDFINKILSARRR
jgi:hypothetical protein